MLSGREFYVDRIEAERMDEQEKTEETLNKEFRENGNGTRKTGP